MVLCYALYVIVRAYLSPQMAPSQDAEIIEGRWKIMLTSLLPPFVLITSVLGSILLGIATPTEAAGVGALGAIFLALSKSSLNRKNISEAVETTTEITAMVTDTKKGMKFCIWHPEARPCLALVDPELTLKLPANLTAWTLSLIHI